ncbi:unnamed protein product [Lymnaea stagnalis]|uniref:Uncharacterized protein n=1 Tax=Lymnaea stagnalis TaxID=6523 RepID=A0AAV2IA18_LYMST
MLTGATLMMLLLSVAGQDNHGCNFISKLKCFRIFPQQSFHKICPPGFLVAAYQLFQYPEYKEIKGKVTVITCLSSGKSEDCRMSGPLNSFGESFDFKCHAGAAMTAVHYNYDNDAEDGIFMVECCKITGKTVTNCERWEENTYMSQYMLASTAAYRYGFQHPAISGFSSKPLIGHNYKTREFILDMCFLK